MRTGDGPCEKCGMFIDNILLTEKTEPDGLGGRNWIAVSGQFCKCGMSIHSVHEPSNRARKEISNER